MSEPHKTRLPTSKPISRNTLRMSNANLGVTHVPSQLRSHAVDLDPSDDETPHATTNALSTSTAPPPASTSKIADAITALFTHMNVIHIDLVERIGLVHERVDLIVERQAHDIVFICDTLSALSCRHTEFIMEVNDFINNIRRR